ncbi:hypothetical protein GQ600_4595 [Phytophthora cactorum]|nr:hypothetical protein GQ600_4595 [Phytophthora cactorum]
MFELVVLGAMYGGQSFLLHKWFSDRGYSLSASGPDGERTCYELSKEPLKQVAIEIPNAEYFLYQSVYDAASFWCY